MSLDKHVDNLVSKLRFEKDMKHGIVFGKSCHQYSVMNFNYAIDNMLKNADGVEFIKQVVKDVIGQLKEGQQILNTNLPLEMMQMAIDQDQKASLKKSPPDKKKISSGQQNKHSRRGRGLN
jgi:hypothetical protein